MSTLGWLLLSLLLSGIVMMAASRLVAFLRGIQRGYREVRERSTAPRVQVGAASTLLTETRSPVVDAHDAARRFGPLNAYQRRLVTIVFMPDEHGATAPAIPHDDLARLLVSPTATRGDSFEA